MTELVPHLGNQMMQDIKSRAIKSSADFLQQSGSTKLELANNLKVENEMYREGVKHLVNIIDNAGAEIEAKDNQIDYYQSKYGETNQQYLQSERVRTVVRTEEKSHAKKLMQKYVNNYNDNNSQNRDTNQPPK